MGYTLATLFQLRQHLGFAASDTAEDARLLVALGSASRMIEGRTNRRFLPHIESRPHSIDRHNARELRLNDDLLTLQGVSDGNGSIDLSDVTVLSSSALRLNSGSVFTYNDLREDAVQVTGIWGFHRDWVNAWAASSDTVQDNPLSASATTLIVSDADAMMPDGSERFQVRQVLQIEAEYLRILALDTTLNTLTVERGVLGSTATSHALNTAIDIFQPESDVVNLCLRWAAWLYREPDVSPGSIPPVLWETLEGLRRISVGG